MSPAEGPEGFPAPENEPNTGLIASGSYKDPPEFLGPWSRRRRSGRP